MNRKIAGTIALQSFLLAVLLSAAWPGRAQDAKTPYPSMALDQYLIVDRNAEIALARSAPEPISRDAEVVILRQHGYDTAVKGKNGFVGSASRF